MPTLAQPRFQAFLRFKRYIESLLYGYEPPVVVSFPKSGRTWLELMLDNLGIKAGLTHDGADHQYRIPFSRLDPDKQHIRTKRLSF